MTTPAHHGAQQPLADGELPEELGLGFGDGAEGEQHLGAQQAAVLAKQRVAVTDALVHRLELLEVVPVGPDHLEEVAAARQVLFPQLEDVVGLELLLPAE